jgi:hypothetical protein
VTRGENSGVDLTLIRTLLGLTPLERLKRMERAARDTRKLNEYGRRHRVGHTNASQAPRSPPEAIDRDPQP